MKTKWVKTTLCAGLAAVMMGALAAPPVLAAPTQQAGVRADETSVAGPAAVRDKQEVVYANLTSEGAVDSVYVVNEFEVTGPGTLNDYGDYTGLTNLTSTAPLTQQGNEISAPVEEGSFFYQGTLDSANLPWQFAVSYALDGDVVGGEQLAGKSGRLQIHITTKQNKAADPNFYNNYMLQISLALDADKCSDITSPNATIANSGKDKSITHTVMPGKDADIIVEANVQDFSMDGIQVAALPFSTPIEIPDTSDMTKEMVTLSDAVASLDDGVGRLASGAQELASGAKQLSDGSADFDSGLAQLGANASTITDGSAQIQTALAAMSAAMNGEDTSSLNLDDFSKLPKALSDLSKGLTAISSGLGELRKGFATAYGALDTAIQGIQAIDQGELAALATVMATLDPTDPNYAAAQSAYGKLMGDYTAAMTVMGTYYGPNGNDGAKVAFDSVLSTIDALTDATSATSIPALAAALSTMSTQVSTALKSMDLSSLQQLASGLATLSTNYDTFHSGLVTYTDGVSTAAAGYSDLNTGLATLADGTATYANGVGQLHNGSSQLSDAVADLPGTMQVEIDKMLDDYDTSDFVPVSFVSAKNTDTSHVQFVLMTPPIAALEADAAGDEEAENTTVWDRVVALFR